MTFIKAPPPWIRFSYCFSGWTTAIFFVFWPVETTELALSRHSLGNECVWVCERVHTDRLEWGGQGVSVGLAPADGEDVHGLDIHDALWQRLRHTWRRVDSREAHTHTGCKLHWGAVHSSHTHTHTRLYLPIEATAGVLWPVWSEPHTPPPAAEGSPPPATCPWQSLCSARSEHRAEFLFHDQNGDLTWCNLKLRSHYCIFKLINSDFPLEGSCTKCRTRDFAGSVLFLQCQTKVLNIKVLKEHRVFLNLIILNAHSALQVIFPPQKW